MIFALSVFENRYNFFRDFFRNTCMLFSFFHRNYIKIAKHEPVPLINGATALICFCFAIINYTSGKADKTDKLLFLQKSIVHFTYTISRIVPSNSKCSLHPALQLNMPMNHNLANE